MMTNNTPPVNVIGVAGFARSGKDTFVTIARKILKENGYTSQQFSFARGLKEDLDPWLIEKYGISAWTTDAAEKALIRPFMVAHGCGKRIQTEGRYWIDKVDDMVTFSKHGFSHSGVDPLKHIYFISDVRFSNEEKWLHEKWNGWLVHLKKYTMVDDVDYTFDYESYPELDGVEHPEDYEPDGIIEEKVVRKVYDKAPNDEEEKNDPLVASKSDCRLELESVIEREKRSGNIITPESIVDNSYLIEEITKCLVKCPFLKLL